MKHYFDKITELSTFKIIISGILIALIGDLKNPLFMALLILIGIDFVTGLIAGFYKKNISSAALRRGVVKLIIYFILIILAYQLQQINELMFFLSEVIYIYLAITEAISILENLFGICYHNNIDLPIINILIMFLYKARTSGIKELKKKTEKMEG